MFEIPQPSMALNSDGVPPPDYRMWNTRKVDDTVVASDLIRNIASVADSAADNYLRCIVFNSHGEPGRILMGTGIGRAETPVFSVLIGKVRTIVIVACRVGLIGQANTWKDGNLLCCEIAKNTQAHVFAATDYQDTGAYTVIGLPMNMIDEFEGSVYKWAPDGSSRQVDNGYVQRWMHDMKMGIDPGGRK
jgi:hypothetical protein